MSSQTAIQNFNKKLKRRFNKPRLISLMIRTENLWQDEKQYKIKAGQ